MNFKVVFLVVVLLIFGAHLSFGEVVRFKVYPSKTLTLRSAIEAQCGEGKNRLIGNPRIHPECELDRLFVNGFVGEATKIGYNYHLTELWVAPTITVRNPAVVVAEPEVGNINSPTSKELNDSVPSPPIRLIEEDSTLKETQIPQPVEMEDNTPVITTVSDKTSDGQQPVAVAIQEQSSYATKSVEPTSCVISSKRSDRVKDAWILTLFSICGLFLFASICLFVEALTSYSDVAENIPTRQLEDIIPLEMYPKRYLFPNPHYFIGALHPHHIANFYISQQHE